MIGRCGQCKHHDMNGRYKLEGFGNCQLELGPLRVAKYFSPEALCNKSKFTPTATTPQPKESK